MIKTLHFDYETRSELDLQDVGIDVYANHPTTKPILLAYAFDDDPVKIWECLTSPMPDEVKEAFQNPDKYLFSAWNSAFERWITDKCLGFRIPIIRWRNPQVIARMVSVPGSLADAGKILDIPQQYRKLEIGEELIRLFCLPFKDKVADTLFGDIEAEFHDGQDRPEEWEKFKSYCINDVECERYIDKALAAFKLPEKELQMWFLDQKINDKGMYVDIESCQNALKLSEKEKDDLLKQISDKTGCANANSRKQIFDWVKTQGYEFKSLGKVFVARALAGECKLTDEAKDVLKLRQKSAKTSYTKYNNILSKVGSDRFIRDQFAFLGASRTGRWASVGLNLQNMPRPPKLIGEKIHEIIPLMHAGDFDALIKLCPNIMELTAGCLRSVFCAPPGMKLVVCDLGSIETRVIAWLAGCQSLLDVFINGLDAYKSFATAMYGVKYEEVTKEQRQNAKPPVLGCGYRLGGGSEGVDRYGNPIRTGLWGYAKNMGVELPQDECARLVRVYRDTYHEVVQLWYDYENAAIATMETKKPVQVGCTVMEAFGGTDFLDRKLLRMTLPSGRCLHYLRPRIIQKEFYGKMKRMVSYEGRDQFTGEWTRIATNGGKFVENAVQAIARDILVEGLLKCDEVGFDISGHCHDEIIAIVPEDSPLDHNKMRECMIAPAEWYKDLPLDAAGYTDTIYKKE